MMSGTVTVAVAIITAIGGAVGGYFALRGAVRTAELKKQTDENAAVLTAYKELVQPLRDENARLVAQIEREREAHAEEMFELKREHAAVLAALQPLNDELGRRRGPSD